MATEAVEQSVRESFGRLIAILSARDHDLAAAEDALGDAVLAALEQWPVQGVPDRPEGWLLAVARRRLIDRARRSSSDALLSRSLALLTEVAEETDLASARFPDERLKLLFVCAHPAIDPAIHAPLMLQTVLGLDAARIATAFLIPASAMGQRLVRAKVKIRDAGIPFAVPEASELPVRLGSVLEAIYAAYGSGWDDVAGADERRSNLTREAIWLGRAIQSLLPEEPEVLGLLALMLYCEARRPARRTVTGDYVPLSEQDVSLWSRGMLHEAETILRAAATAKRPGRFQLEASIQSAHIGHRLIGEPDNAIIAQLHEALWRMAPRIGLAVARAVAWADSRGPEAGLALLDEIEPKRVAAYQPYHAARAELLARSGQIDAARTHYATAIRLANDPAARRYLELRRSHLLS